MQADPTHPPETPLEQARRHVAEGRARVEHQAAIVARLAEDGHDTATAEAILITTLEALELMREHLAQEEARAAPIEG